MRNTRRQRLQHGVSLIEIMVGVAIALITTLVIFQVFLSTTVSSRSTAAGNEAQIAGNIGYFQLERDLKVAGMGLGNLPNDGAAACTVRAIHPTVPPAPFTFPMLPLLITPGASPAAPDGVDILFGNSSYMVAGRRYTGGDAISKDTSSRGGIYPGDVLVLTDLVTPPADCEVIQVTSTANVNGLTIDHAQGGPYLSPYIQNSAGTPNTLNDGGMIYNLGGQPALNRWRVAGNNVLTVTNALGTGVAGTVAEGIVHMQAEYGLRVSGTSASCSIDSWTKLAPASWSQVMAVRVAVLARSSQLEKTLLATAPAWAGGSFDMTAIPDWQHYRYRIYESVIPLRNVIWGVCS